KNINRQGPPDVFENKNLYSSFNSNSNNYNNRTYSLGRQLYNNFNNPTTTSKIFKKNISNSQNFNKKLLYDPNQSTNLILNDKNINLRSSNIKKPSPHFNFDKILKNDNFNI